MSAVCCVIIPPASCTDGINRSTISAYLCKSNKHMVIICLSLIIPNALNTINSGIGLRTLGIFTTMFLNESLSVGFIILTERVLIGFDTFSDTDLISAEYKYVSSSTLRIYSILSPNFS